jgi:hypothetical protein
MALRSRAQGFALASLTALFFFGVYVSRLCPTLSLAGDSAELVSAAALWGVPHPPGYPLYTAIGHLFAALPTHTVPWRVHLTSAVFHAATIAAVCAATLNLTASRLAAAVASCALGMSRTFMLGSLYAEVFPLNDLFFACLMALALRLAREGRSANSSLFVLLAAVAGLASSHHMMIVLAAPALAVLTWRPMAAFVRGRPSRGATLLLAYLAPLLVYALVPIAASRSPALSWGDVHDWTSLFRLVTRQDYGGLLSPTRTPTSEPAFARLVAFGRLLAASMGAAPIAAAAMGLADPRLRRGGFAASLALAIVVPGPLFALANALGTSSEETLAYFERFTAMCHVPLAIAAGAGVAAIQSAFGARRELSVAGVVALVVWAFAGARRVRDVDLRDDWRGLAFAHDLVLGSPERSLILLSGDEPGNAALYVCAVENACGRRTVLSPGSLFLPWKMAQIRKRYPDLEIPWAEGPALRRTHELAAAAAGSRPVFVYPDLLQKDAALTEAFSPLPDGLLYRLWPRGSPLDMQREAFLDSARAMASGQGCEGCRLAAPIRPRPSSDAQIARTYEAAFMNHARAARAIEGEADLAGSLEARAGEMAALTASRAGR